MDDNTKQIAALNDRFRRSFLGGRVMFTSGILALPEMAQRIIVAKVQTFNDFTADNDPYGEHDFGALDVEEAGKIFWKIDYYAPDLVHGSEDPADPENTVRVLTIMLSHEY